MKWITRERPMTDKIACPWLLKNFVYKEIEFIFVPRDLVFALTSSFDAIPYNFKDEFEQLEIGMKV